MKENYEVPQISVLELELENILCSSDTSLQQVTDGGSAW